MSTWECSASDLDNSLVFPRTEYKDVSLNPESSNLEIVYQINLFEVNVVIHVKSYLQKTSWISKYGLSPKIINSKETSPHLTQ